jgi:aminomethyltransferase
MRDAAMSLLPRRSPLASEHRALGARMVEHEGWSLPWSYGPDIDEHQAVRHTAGMFDISHLLAVDVQGRDARTYLRYVLANDVDGVPGAGGALLSCLLSDQGGIIDHPMVYRLGADAWRLVLNAGCADAAVAWMDHVHQTGGWRLAIQPRRDLAMLALQGPHAAERFWAARAGSRPLAEPLARRTFVEFGNLMVAHTGYTGEGGYECFGPIDAVTELWRDLVALGVRPCGLAARDSLRIEAGLVRYGLDTDADASPYESGLGDTVCRHDAARDFIGRRALEARPASCRLAGLIVTDADADEQADADLPPPQAPPRVRLPAILIAGEPAEGHVTSLARSPMLGVPIALARLPDRVPEGTPAQVEMGGVWRNARVCALPFVRRGHAIAPAPPPL